MGTVTSKFGVSGRVSHDASPFYDRFHAHVPVEPGKIVEVPAEGLDKIYNRSSEVMHELPTNSVSLIVTSPPYHVGKDYDTDDSFDDYLDLLINVFTECERVLQPGGRLAINLANLGRKPYIPLTTYVDAMCHDIGYLPRGQLVWLKADGAGGSTAFGSYLSASNPVIRDVHEYVLVYSKGQFGKPYRGESTLTKEEFLEYTLSTWRIQPASAKRIGHPAPFPVELPRRLIKLYTYRNDLVLDPFMGSGQTALAAIETDRHYVGYDTSADYCALASHRIEELRGTN